MTTLTPPSAEEQELYYFGLPSCPKLIARSSSSTRIWTNPQMPGWSSFTGTLNMYPRTLRPVERHPPLRRLWNDGTSSLRVGILEAVNEADWTAIDILRVGLAHEDYHTTLMVAVVPDTLSWSRGHAIALRCKSLLEEHGIDDVHCEIRESVVLPCAEKQQEIDAFFGSPTTFQLSSGPMPTTDVFPPDLADFTDCLGTRIAAHEHTNDRTGTKGLYLSLAPSSPEAEPRLLALTCRHVMVDAKSGENETYKWHDVESSPRRDIIQIDQPTYKERIKSLGGQYTACRKVAKDSLGRGQAEQAADFIERSDSALAVEKAMRHYEAASSRVIGHLLYSPEFSSVARGTKWLRDWALIELHPTSHQAPLSSIKNKVYTGPLYDFKFFKSRNEAGWPGPGRPFPPRTVADCFDLRKEVVPIAELLNSTEETEETDGPMFVATYGAKKQLTFGVGNALKSLVRRTGYGLEFSEEWAIIGDAGSSFAREGDSGACVWDMEGRPAGIVTAGCGLVIDFQHNVGALHIPDITYAQPMDSLLADIKAHGFDVSLV